MEGTLMFACLCFICPGSDTCVETGKLQDATLSVPTEAAMLTSSLLSPRAFNYSGLPYNITWYDSQTGREIINEKGRTLVSGEFLWFLDPVLEDTGDYVCVVRTHSQCFKEYTKLIVQYPINCGRPNKTKQSVINASNGALSCPLMREVTWLKRYSIPYNIQWYKNCNLINVGIPSLGKQKFSYRENNSKLQINDVEPVDNGTYTCTLSFSLAGVRSNISETIDCMVKVDYVDRPQVVEPVNETVKVPLGFYFKKTCRVFVPSSGDHAFYLNWKAKGNIISRNASDRIHQEPTREYKVGIRGVWLECVLTISHVEEEDMNCNYTCTAISMKMASSHYFTLLPADPNRALSIGFPLIGLMVFLTACLLIYKLFKIDIVLWFRGTASFFYSSGELDGKLYDAYVTYPRLLGGETTREVEMFALHTLPQVLEKKCGYKLFILDRDSQPGQVILESAEESMQASRCLLFLYTASTFSSTKTSPDRGGESRDEKLPESGHQFESVAAMHRALLEGSLQVVLVELEEVTPTQLALFPESVRHLREKQGAVCWWKSQRTKKRWKRYFWKEDDNKTAELDISSQFWKEIRYHMPVRCKRRTYRENNSLLNA